MARPSNRAAKREQILAAFAGVLAQHGYARATILKIAQAARLAPGLVHYHFSNKAEILRTLAASLAQRRDARFEALSADATDPRERLFAFIDAHVAFGPGSDAAAVRAWSVLGAEAQRDPEVKTLYEKTMRHSLATCEQLLRDWLRREGRDTQAAPTHALALLATIEGVFHLAASAPKLVPRGFAAPALRAMAEAVVLGEARRL